MEVIIGIIFGMVVATGVGYWSMRRTNSPSVATLEPAVEEQDWKQLSYPVQQQLRHAIFECEQELKKCNNELEICYKNQLDLAEEVGKVSYIEVKGKPLFFEYNNSLTGEHRFYYERDLKKIITNEVITTTKKLLEQYQTQVDLLEIQQQLFKNLISSHQQNLEQIEQPEKISPITEKLKKHQDYLKQQTTATNTVEQQAIYNQLLLEQIAEEVQYQVDYIEQYRQLKEAHDSTTSGQEEAAPSFKIKLEEMMEQIEAKHPKF